MKKLVCALMFSMLATLAIGQVTSPNGNFTATTPSGSTTPSNLSLQTGTTPTTRLTILQSNGFVGIGTTAPSDLLHVNGNLRGTQLNLTGGILNTTGSTTNLSFRTNNTARMTILGYNGYVGIGTNSPANQLQIGPNPNGWGGNDLVVANGNGGLAISTNATETYLWGSKDVSIRPGNGVQSIYAKSDGNVGIGTTAPTEKLSIKQPGAAFALTDASITNTDYSTFKIWANNQNVFGLGVGAETKASYNPQLLFDGLNNSIIASGTLGIGTTTVNPAYKLDVNGTINATGILVNGQPISGGSSVWTNIGTDINFLLGSVGIGKAPATGNKLDVSGAINAASYKVNGTALVGSQWATSGANLFYNSTGNVGIGTATASTAKLNVYRAGAGTTVLIGSPTTTSGNFTSLALGTSADKDGATFINSIKSAAATPVFGDLVINQNGGTVGNVGIGKAPASGYKLDVAGTINATSVFVNGQPISGGGASQWITGTGNISYSTGNVGIGTSSPSSKLDIFGNSAATTNLILSANYSDRYRWRMKTLDRGNAIDLDFTASDGSDTEETILQLSRSNSTRPEFRVMTDWLVANDAKIGIGTTTPSDKLEVNGNINVGLNSGAATGYGNRLNMRGVADDGDPIWMSRYNAGPNQTELRVNIGDDAGGEDGFTVGNFFYDDGQWKTFFKVLNNGNVGIGTTAPDAKLTVKGTGAGGAGGLKIINANEVYPQWGLVISQQDNLTGSITSYGRDLQIQPGWDKTLILGSNEMQANGGKVIFPGGNVGIGTTAPDAKLTVKGTIHTNEVKVDLNVPGPDYVFEKGYDLMSLEETKAYIDANKHLPEVPSAKEMEKNGVQLGEMNLLLLKKVEELTLHILRQNEILQRQNDRLEKLERKSKK